MDLNLQVEEFVSQFLYTLVEIFFMGNLDNVHFLATTSERRNSMDM